MADTTPSVLGECEQLHWSLISRKTPDGNLRDLVPLCQSWAWAKPRVCAGAWPEAAEYLGTETLGTEESLSPA